MSHGVLSPLVVHNRLPFQPAFGSSMRPSITWTTTTGTYGGAGVEIPEADKKAEEPESEPAEDES